VEDFRIAPHGIPAEAQVVTDDPAGFGSQARLMILVAAKIQEPNPLIRVQLRRVNFVTSNEVEGNALSRQSVGEAQSIRTVPATGKQSHTSPESARRNAGTLPRRSCGGQTRKFLDERVIHTVRERKRQRQTKT